MKYEKFLNVVDEKKRYFLRFLTPCGITRKRHSENIRQ